MALDVGLNDDVIRRTLAMLSATQGLGDQAEWARRLRAQLDPTGRFSAIDWYNTIRQADRIYMTTRGLGMVNEAIGPLRGMPTDPTARATGFDYRARVVVTAHFPNGVTRGTVVVIDFDRPMDTDQLRALAQARAQTQLNQGLGPIPGHGGTGQPTFTTEFSTLGRSPVGG